MGASMSLIILRNSFSETFNYKLIYVFRINDEAHKNCLKIGDATLKTHKSFDQIKSNSEDLIKAAKSRIDSYTSTAGVSYELLYTEIAVYLSSMSSVKPKIKAFRDHQVHEVLKRSGVKNKYFNVSKKQNEWFVADLDTAKKAIKAVKENRKFLNQSEITETQSPIIFRPEQLKSIKETILRFKETRSMLWNAKMRFGKTLTTLQVVKEMGFKKTLILTHRPVVKAGWFEDFNKIFYDTSDYDFGSKTFGGSIDSLIKKGKNFIYFATIQDLRQSEKVGGNFRKNENLFSIFWDFVVVDEAHEGTKTELGKSVLENIIKPDSKYATFTLQLSGTPFNLLSDFETSNIFTWDYIMEQDAKNKWIVDHYGDSNPYEELPKMNIYTYKLEENIKGFIDIEDKAFNFREFFRTWTGDIKKDFDNLPIGSEIGDFVHEKEIISFLNLTCKSDNESNYPFSTEKNRELFRHSLWVVPGVKEAKALSYLLKKHIIFSNFNIVNVAGDGDEEIDTSRALEEVRKAITEDSNNTSSITLTCGRLTTGVSVPEWTAVLMLSGAYSTSASQYLQTIFRVQNPANIDGKIKENCYVFDFAPDRTLKMIAEAVQLSSKAGSNNSDSETNLRKFLNFCPVISIDKSGMREYKVDYLLQELKKVYAERVAKNGFDDIKLYNDELLKLDSIQLGEFDNLKKLIGVSKSQHKTNNVDINTQGFTEEEFEREQELKKKNNKTSEDLEELKELAEKRKNKSNAISILRSISIRIPLLIYGIDIDINEDITLQNFSNNDLIDDLSWDEFMPKGVTREIFNKFSKYYDKDIFIAAGRRIRTISKAADELEPTERVLKISNLLSTFKNPDKETVLTPWRVVNMHLSQTLGGYVFFDDKFEKSLEQPVLVENKDVTKKVFSTDSKILEINSKTGLYPLYLVYSIYRNKCSRFDKEELSVQKLISIWDDTVSNNLFVICKTPMSKLITKRTLIGYRNSKVNTKYFEDLINQLKQENKLVNFIHKIRQGKSYWKTKESDDMKFNAIVGNPPYQSMDGGAQASSVPIYHYFVNASQRISPDYISLIMPSRWMTSGKGLDEFRFQMIHDKRIRLMHDYFDASKCFSNVEIKGGICYFLWDKTYEGKSDIFTHFDNGEIVKSNRFLSIDETSTFFVRDAKLINILQKVKSKSFPTFDEIVSSRKPYGLTADFFKNPMKYNLPPIKSDPFPNCLKIMGLGDKQKREFRYIPFDYPIQKTDGLDELKIFIPESFGNGIMGESPASPIIANPNTLCLETFLQIRPVKNENNAKNIIAYMKTKFFRVILGITKNTQHGTQKVYSLIPLVDFNKEWSDIELFKLFNFSSDEIEYINYLIPN
jgi:superfamily II DNA or RNA helicase